MFGRLARCSAKTSNTARISPKDADHGKGDAGNVRSSGADLAINNDGGKMAGNLSKAEARLIDAARNHWRLKMAKLWQRKPIADATREFVS